VKAGKITEAQIDESLIRLLKGRYELGDLDDPSLVEWSTIAPDTIDCQTHKNVALEATRKSIVLLQNNNNILPLKAETKVLVMGENAVDSTMMWGNYNGFPSHTITILEGLQQIGQNVEYYAGIPMVTPADAPYSTDEAALQEKVKAADVIVFVGGITPRLEGEEMDVKYPGFRGGDRTSIELPEVQRQMIEKLHKTGKPIVFVNCSGSAIAMAPEKKICNAIVQAWYGGQCGGQALAEVLYGKVNPSGKLTMTWPIAATDHPSTKNFPGMLDFYSYQTMKSDGKQISGYDYTNHEEDIYVGYRYFDTFNKAVAYPFGFGLSYTTFAYGKPIVKVNGNDVFVTVNIKNTGKVSGKEIAQVYVSAPKGTIEKPTKELKAFAKTRELQPGESETLTMKFAKRDLASFDEANSQWLVEAGTYTAHIGTNIADIKGTATFKMNTYTEKVSEALKLQHPLNLLKQKQ
jgi:beta-glucosidase